MGSVCNCIAVRDHNLPCLRLTCECRWLQRRRKYFHLFLCFKMPWQGVPCPNVMLDEQGPSVTVHWSEIALFLLFSLLQSFHIPTLSNARSQSLALKFLFWLLPEEGSELLPAVSLPDRLLSGFPSSQPLIRAPRAVSGASSRSADIPAECLVSGGKNSRASTGLNSG